MKKVITGELPTIMASDQGTVMNIDEQGAIYCMVKQGNRIARVYGNLEDVYIGMILVGKICQYRDGDKITCWYSNDEWAVDTIK